MNYKILVPGIVFMMISATACADGFAFTHVPNANTKVTGMSKPNMLSPELREVPVATGNMPLENPTATIAYYGYDNDGTLLPAFNSNAEASKSEPDKNTYLRLTDQDGADVNYNYGKHFLFQGHETGTQGYITRINLDADVPHRVTLMADKDINNTALPKFDGSTWDPFAQKLLFTAELGSGGGVCQATLNYPSSVECLYGYLGQGGYEGIQNDSLGNLWIVEDVSGSSGATKTHAKRPNSFVYRYVPNNPADLKQGGKLQALQVLNGANQPIVYNAAQSADTAILSSDLQALHTYGNTFQTNWITIHDTSIDGITAFSANALAKTKNATPFKRPENGVFRPGKSFTEFYFTETGDTNALTEAAAYGGFGAVMKISQASAGANSGTITMFYKGDVAHTGFDNLAFLNSNNLIVVEDAGDSLHTQRNALDSAYMLDVSGNTSYATGALPVRMLAQGRDTSATIDSGLSGSAGFQNEGDNEITGIHVSDGGASRDGILGAKSPSRMLMDNWRMFYTQQHGDNTTYEIVYKLPRN